MSLWTFVELSDEGDGTADDGQSSWSTTSVHFGWGTHAIFTDVRFDAYSGKAIAQIVRNDFDLPTDLLRRLALALHSHCGKEMRAFHSDLSRGPCDLEKIIHRVFYRSHAEQMLRKFRSVLVTGCEVIQVAP